MLRCTFSLSRPPGELCLGQERRRRDGGVRGGCCRHVRKRPGDSLTAFVFAFARWMRLRNVDRKPTRFG